MRRAAKIDANQSGLVEVFRALGCSVQSLAEVGGGCPDLLLGIAGNNVLAEIKDGSLPPSHRRLTAFQKTWHENWRGKVHLIETEAQAAELVAYYRGVLRRRS